MDLVTVITPVSLSAANPTMQTSPVAVDPLTDEIKVRIQLPTTLVPLAWTASAAMRVTLVLKIDGVEHIAQGQVSGGVRTRSLVDANYVLVYRPTVQMVNGATRRIGETSRTSITAFVRLERVRGTIATNLLSALTTESAAPMRESHNSAAYDADSSAEEINGDGIVSVTHTPAGTDNLAAFAHGARLEDSGLTGQNGTMTYDGVAMTELWDIEVSASYQAAGYVKAGTPTGAKTVTYTTGTGPDYKTIIVVTATGVHQTTPNGTAVTATGTTGTPTVTVADFGPNDLIIDGIMFRGTGALGAAGANQTEQARQDQGNWKCAASTKLGSVGSGVMTWAITGGFNWILGAFAFKAAAVAGITAKSYITRQAVNRAATY